MQVINNLDLFIRRQVSFELMFNFFLVLQDGNNMVSGYTITRFLANVHDLYSFMCNTLKFKTELSMTTLNGWLVIYCTGRR